MKLFIQSTFQAFRNNKLKKNSTNFELGLLVMKDDDIHDSVNIEKALE